MLPLFPLQGSLLSTDMAENSPPPPSPAAAVAEPESRSSRGPRSLPPLLAQKSPWTELTQKSLTRTWPLLPSSACDRPPARNWCIKMVCNPYPLWGLGLSGFCRVRGPSGQMACGWTEAEAVVSVRKLRCWAWEILDYRAQTDEDLASC